MGQRQRNGLSCQSLAVARQRPRGAGRRALEADIWQWLGNDLGGWPSSGASGSRLRLLVMLHYEMQPEMECMIRTEELWMLHIELPYAT